MVNDADITWLRDSCLNSPGLSNPARVTVPHRESSEHGSSAIKASNAPPSSPSVQFPGSTHVGIPAHQPFLFFPGSYLNRLTDTPKAMNNGLKINAIHPGPSNDTISRQMSICWAQGFPQAFHIHVPGLSGIRRSTKNCVLGVKSRSRPFTYLNAASECEEDTRNSFRVAVNFFRARCVLRGGVHAERKGVGSEANWVRTSPCPRKSRAAARVERSNAAAMTARARHHANLEVEGPACGVRRGENSAGGELAHKMSGEIRFQRGACWARTWIAGPELWPLSARLEVVASCELRPPAGSGLIRGQEVVAPVFWNIMPSSAIGPVILDGCFPLAPLLLRV
ncbi:hypothetical protein DFH09DRAFT_1098987 [Mycena vulgaris]|nr:hypothetical protein DFH09DRAFT_1098987 [Mycena vulgaris]